MCVKINKTIFKKKWEELEKYYKKSHTREEANFFYLQIKDLTDAEFTKMVNLTYKNCKYFPNISEFWNMKPDNKFEDWESIQPESLNEEDKAFVRAFYKKYCNTEEEADRRIKELGLEEKK